MIDGCKRNIDYLRISVTDRCNLRCIYCMPEEGISSLPHDEVLSYEEIVRLCTNFASLGIKKIKITGGEPLIRKNVSDLISQIKAIPGIDSVTLTTNGILLKPQLSQLLSAGLNGINISLDTLDPRKYHMITRMGRLEDAVDGLFAALEAVPSVTVKINCVLYYGSLENIISMAQLAQKYPVHVRFIEMMPIGLGSGYDLCSENTVIEILTKKFGVMEPVNEILGNGPCHYYKIAGFLGKIGFISAVTHKFCSECNRIRLTAAGYLKTCLQYDTGVDLKALLRSGANDDILQTAIKDAVHNKPVSHHFSEAPQEADQTKTDECLSMFQIGG